MGKVLLVWRLAVKDLRHRPVQAMLLLLAIGAGAATLTLGLSLRGTTDNPYERTRAATRGPDLVATLFPGQSSAPGPATTVRPGGPGPSDPADQSGLVGLEDAPGVATHSGPFPVTWALLQAGHATGTAEVEGRSSSASPVDQPRMVAGTWLRPGGAVVEAAFAHALGLRVGDRLTLGGSPVEVVGIAVTAAVPSYPQACFRLGCFLAGTLATHNPGLVWVNDADVQRLAAAGSEPVVYFLNLKLTDPTAAPAFAARYNASGASNAASLFSWQEIRTGDAQVVAKLRLALLYGSWLLALLAVASVVVLVGGRMAEQTRRVGLLKAVGATPRLVAVVLLFEHALVGLGAAGLGLLAGWLAAPLIDGPGAGLLGAPSAPTLSASTLALVVAMALAVAIVATFVPAIRAARQSTVAALEDSARVPARRPWVIRFSGHLPAPLLLGVRLATRRPRRLLLNVFSVAVTSGGIVAVLVLRASAGPFLAPQVAQATTTISVMLVILAAVNAVFIAWATALDARRPAALARALGATPGQVTTGLSVAQLVPALIGALLGILAGIGLSAAANKGPGPTIPAAPWLALVVVATTLVMAVLTAIPTRIGACRPVAEVLQSETA